MAVMMVVLVLHLVGFIAGRSDLACFARLHCLFFVTRICAVSRAQLMMFNTFTQTLRRHCGVHHILRVPRPNARQRARRGAVADAAALDAPDGALFCSSVLEDIIDDVSTVGSVRCSSLWEMSITSRWTLFLICCGTKDVFQGGRGGSRQFYPQQTIWKHCVVSGHCSERWLLFVAPLWIFVLLVFASGIIASEKAFRVKYCEVEGYMRTLSGSEMSEMDGRT